MGLQVGIRSINKEGRDQAKRFGVEQYEMRHFHKDRAFLESLVSETRLPLWAPTSLPRHHPLVRQPGSPSGVPLGLCTLLFRPLSEAAVVLRVGPAWAAHVFFSGTSVPLCIVASLLLVWVPVSGAGLPGRVRIH